MIIKPAQRIQGALRLPGDKSISHRAALIAALANGSSRLQNFSSGEDCASTISCLRQLGVTIHWEGPELVIDSRGTLNAPNAMLDCGNSGSTMRMLAGVLAGQDFAATLTGDNSLRNRPMVRIIEPLELMGVRIDSQNGQPPLQLHGTRSLDSINYECPVVSAQVKSCILLAALNANGRTQVIEKTATRDHTERMLQWFGVPVEITRLADSDGALVAVEGVADLPPRDVAIPGDISSAAFFIAAAALLPDSNLMIQDVGLNPTRTQFLTTLQSMGAQIEITDLRETCNEPLGSIHVRGGLRSDITPNPDRNSVPAEMVPGLIDELPLLAVVGTQIEGGLEIRHATELRVKETDRIAATVSNLRAMGAGVEEFPDGLAVAGPVRLQGASIDPHGDHRIAMAFAAAALIAEGESEISSADCVSVSFPEFFELLEAVTTR